MRRITRAPLERSLFIRKAPTPFCHTGDSYARGHEQNVSAVERHFIVLRFFESGLWLTTFVNIHIFLDLRDFFILKPIGAQRNAIMFIHPCE